MLGFVFNTTLLLICLASAYGSISGLLNLRWQIFLKTKALVWVMIAYFGAIWIVYTVLFAFGAFEFILQYYLDFPDYEVYDGFYFDNSMGLIFGLIYIIVIPLSYYAHFIQSPR